MSKDKMIEWLEVLHKQIEVTELTKNGRIMAVDILFYEVETAIREMPEQKVGYWTEEKHPDAMPTLTTTWCCSVCGKDQGYGEPPFCPNCGAPMERQA